MKTKVLILWAFMAILCPVEGQNLVAAPEEGATTLTNGIGSSSSNAKVVCPGSQDEFFVNCNLENTINPDQVSFQWRVFGGTIEGDPNPDNTQYTNTLSEVTLSGVNANNQSFINITWDSKICMEAWVAVRQISEHGCVSNQWSVFHIDVDDIQGPALEVPIDRVLCEQEGIDSISVNNISITSVEDNCSLQSEIAITYTIQFPDSKTISGDGDASTKRFPVGTSIITYRATDKWGNPTSKSFKVIVNPLPSITEISYN